MLEPPQKPWKCLPEVAVCFRIRKLHHHRPSLHPSQRKSRSLHLCSAHFKSNKTTRAGEDASAASRRREKHIKTVARGRCCRKAIRIRPNRVMYGNRACLFLSGSKKALGNDLDPGKPSQRAIVVHNVHRCHCLYPWGTPFGATDEDHFLLIRLVWLDTHCHLPF